MNTSDKDKTRHREPTRIQLRLLGCIDDAGKEGAFLSKRELADKLSCSMKTIDRGVIRLRALGLIEVRARYDVDGRQVANVYRTRESARDDVDWYCLALEKLASR